MAGKNRVTVGDCVADRVGIEIPSPPNGGERDHALEPTVLVRVGDIVDDADGGRLFGFGEVEAVLNMPERACCSPYKGDRVFLMKGLIEALRGRFPEYAAKGAAITVKAFPGKEPGTFSSTWAELAHRQLWEAAPQPPSPVELAASEAAEEVEAVTTLLREAGLRRKAEDPDGADEASTAAFRTAVEAFKAGAAREEVERLVEAFHISLVGLGSRKLAAAAAAKLAEEFGL